MTALFYSRGTQKIVFDELILDRAVYATVTGANTNKLLDECPTRIAGLGTDGTNHGLAQVDVGFFNVTEEGIKSLGIKYDGTTLSTYAMPVPISLLDAAVTALDVVKSSATLAVSFTYSNTTTSPYRLRARLKGAIVYN